jgi:hypothetical protein
VTVDAPPDTQDAFVASDAKPQAPFDMGVFQKPGKLPASTWDVDYPLTGPAPSWCKTGWASCMPLADAASSTGDAKAVACPASISVDCPCNHMGPGPCNEGFDLGGPVPGGPRCSAPLNLSVTNSQRGLGKKSACCYTRVVRCTPPGVGRILREDGGSVTASPEPRDDWSDDALVVDVATLDAVEREEVAAHYRAVAAGEHAAIASFAEASLMLLAHGAPADLVEGTHRAALDEIAHARIAYALARVYGGDALGPSCLEVPRLRPSSLVEFAVAVLLDACLPETVGAVIATQSARGASDGALRAALSRIAEDETRHAELAFRSLAWAVRKGGIVVAHAIERALSAAQLPAPSRATAHPTHGVLGEAQERRLIAMAAADLVHPCVEALLASESSSLRGSAQLLVPALAAL